MIHDAKVEVTCDGERCRSSVDVDLHMVYPDLSGRGGRYDHDDVKVEKSLVANEGWIVIEGKHFCCPECVPADLVDKAAA